jgi:hypothetical protein
LVILSVFTLPSSIITSFILVPKGKYIVFESAGSKGFSDDLR